MAATVIDDAASKYEELVCACGDGEDPLPAFPCGCGKHKVYPWRPGQYGQIIHWQGEHWDVKCAFTACMVAMGAAATDAKSA